MTESVYLLIFYGGAILASLMFILSIVLFFVLRISHVVGDLTGSNARKAIENIRSQNEASGEKIYKSSYTNINRGKITDKISPSGNLLKNSNDTSVGAMSTEKISVSMDVSGETTLLEASNETTVLTSVSSDTTVLEPAINSVTTFTVEYEITFIHTNEVIV